MPLLDDFDHASRQYDELAAGLSALFDEPGLMLSRRRFFADVVDDKMGRYSLGDKGRMGGRILALENAYEKVLGRAALTAALNALPAGAPRLALCRKLAADASNAVLALHFWQKVSAMGALALRRDARKLFATLGGVTAVRGVAR